MPAHRAAPRRDRHGGAARRRGFADCGEVHAALPAFAAEKLSETFDADGAHFHVRLPADAVEGFRARLRDATRDRVRIGDNG